MAPLRLQSSVVKIMRSDCGWFARDLDYPILGQGPTPTAAVEDWEEKCRHVYTGDRGWRRWRRRLIWIGALIGLALVIETSLAQNPYFMMAGINKTKHILIMSFEKMKPRQRKWLLANLCEANAYLQSRPTNEVEACWDGYFSPTNTKSP